MEPIINRPEISIVIPTYNRSTIIGKTIDSFLAQDFKEWELIIVDDYSTDNTKDTIVLYCQKDSRIHYLLNERKKGAQGARNTGILHSSADWICLFDSDDYAFPSFLSIMRRCTTSNVGVVTCYLNLHYVDNNACEVAPWAEDGYIEKKLMQGETYVGFDNSIIRKSALEYIGLLDEDCPNYQEFDTHLRLSRYYRYKAVKEVLLDYYLGMPDSISFATQKNLIGRIYIFCKMHKRWRKVSYSSFVKTARLLYFDADKIWKKRIICCAPEIIPLIPFLSVWRHYRDRIM